MRDKKTMKTKEWRRNKAIINLSILLHPQYAMWQVSLWESHCTLSVYHHTQKRDAHVRPASGHTDIITNRNNNEWSSSQTKAAKVARQRSCSTQYNPNRQKNPEGLDKKQWKTSLCFVLLPLYLSLREEGVFLQVTTGLHGLLKLTSDVVLTWTRDSLMESRQQEKN